MQRLAILETAVSELTLRIDSLSRGLARVAGIAERAAAIGDSTATRLTTQGEKLQRVLLDSEGNRRDIKELTDSVGVSVDDVTASLKEIREEIRRAAYVELVAHEALGPVDYYKPRAVVRESVAVVVKRLADAAGIELVAAPPINKPGMIHAVQKAPEAVVRSGNRLWSR